MGISQHAHQPIINVGYTPEPIQQLRPFVSAIDLSKISISQLLGRDYIFIEDQPLEISVDGSQQLNSSFEDLIHELELSEAHTVVVSVTHFDDGSRDFTRYDLTWYKHRVCRSVSSHIINADQKEFVDMIWQCSSAVAIV